MEFLDKHGLSILWDKIKAYIDRSIFDLVRLVNHETAVLSHRHLLKDLIGIDPVLDTKMDKKSIVLCQTQEEAKEKASSGEYDSGTIFLIRKQE